MRGDLLLVTTCSLSEFYWFVLLLTVVRPAVFTVSHCWSGILAKCCHFIGGFVSIVLSQEEFLSESGVVFIFYLSY